MSFRHLTAAAVLIALSACVTPNGVDTPAAALGRTLRAAATIPVGKAPHGVAYSQGYVYIGNTGSGSVSVIDTGSDKVVKELAFGGSPSYTTASPDGKYVVNLDTTGKLRVIDPAQGAHTVVQTLEPGKGLDKVVFSADGTKLAVSLADEAVLPLYAFAQGFAQAPTRSQYAIGTVVGVGHKHRAMAYRGDYLLAPNTGENDVSLVNTATGQVETLKAGNSPSVVALAGDGADMAAVIGNQASNTLTIVRLADKTSKTFAGGLTPTDVAVRDDGRVAFVTNAGGNDVSVVDVAGMKEITKVPVGKRPVHIYAVGTPLHTHHAGHDETASEQIWVMNDDGASVTVIDAVSYTVLATVSVGQGHHKAAFSPTKAYITNITSGDVSVIERSSVH